MRRQACFLIEDMQSNIEMRLKDYSDQIALSIAFSTIVTIFQKAFKRNPIGFNDVIKSFDVM